MISTPINSLISVLAAVSFVSCSEKPGTISGKITGAENTIIQLINIADGRGASLIETTADAAGKFSITPPKGLPLDYYGLKTADGKKFLLLITDSTESIYVEAEAASIEKSTKVQGSPNTQRFLDLQSEMLSIQQKMDDLAQPDVDGVIRQEAGPEYQKLVREKRSKSVDFISNNPQSPVCLIALSQLNIRQDIDQYLRVKNNLREVMAGSKYYQAVVAQTDNARAQQNVARQAPPAEERQVPGMISEGDSAPEIAQKSPNGKTYKLSDLKGKVVLIDFWASWCGPCRKENPTVVAAYKKYKAKGFEVFSVSLDQATDKWTAAIAQDGLEWPYHVSDLKGWQNSAAQLYKVASIPRTFLLDKNGKVLASNLRGPALEQKLKEILG